MSQNVDTIRLRRQPYYTLLLSDSLDTLDTTMKKRKKLIEYTPNQLYTRLQKRKLTQLRIFEIINWVEQRKESLKARAREARVMDKAWGELLQPLSLEIKRVQSTLPYHIELGNTATADFFSAYLKLLEKLRGKLQRHQQDREDTPRQLAQKNRHSIRNDGTEWVDWIPQHIIDTFNTQYELILPKPRAQKRKIFEVQAKRDNGRRLRLAQEMSEYRTHIDTSTERGKQEYALYEEGHVRLFKLPPKAKTPDTVYGLFLKDELKAQYPLLIKEEE